MIKLDEKDLKAVARSRTRQTQRWIFRSAFGSIVFMLAVLTFLTFVPSLYDNFIKNNTVVSTIIVSILGVIVLFWVIFGTIMEERSIKRIFNELKKEIG